MNAIALSASPSASASSLTTSGTTAQSAISESATPTFRIQLELKTSAGTYVKEFIHGDNGRTNPSLFDLMKMDWAKCLELDVLDVELDWPEDVEADEGAEFEVVA